MGILLNCKCDHAFQDKACGTGVRVHNPCIKDSKLSAYRCTVCGAEKAPSGEATTRKVTGDGKRKP